MSKQTDHVTDPKQAQAWSATDHAAGLTQHDAAQRLAVFGPNAVNEQQQAWWLLMLDKLWGPVPWMLETVMALQCLLGRLREALVILFLLAFNAAVSFAQERRARDAMTLLRHQLQVRARVLRDGGWRQIPAAQLVPGDVVHVRAGDIVPADLQLFEGQVALDQSALTGESLAVDAVSGAPAYAGAIVRQGEASGEVVATGTRTYFGRTAELVRTSSPPSHMQQTIFAIVKNLVVFDVLLVLIVIAYAASHGLPVGDTAVFALMLLVASVPVALPATSTLATAVASSRLAARGVLVTRLAAVEEAAAMDVLLSDKTGTLTRNVLDIAGVHPLAEVDRAEVLRVARMASDPATQDPLDLAFMAAPGAEIAAIPPVRTAFRPFDPATRCSESVFTVDGSPWHALKGAPSALADRCCADAALRDELAVAKRELAANGARVMAVAAGRDGAIRMIGLVGLADPPREDAAALIARLRQLGVHVAMASGDALETARAVAAQVGLGDRVCGVGAEDLQTPEDCDVFARVLPQDKHAIVRALQRRGHVTGMTGDGVNDAPALKQAELGIAVASATDVAKAAAGVVLIDPGLTGVLDVVSVGREVHRRLLTYTLNKIVKTLEIVVFLTLGLWLSGGFIISAHLIVLLLFANDFVTMSIALDRVTPAARPQRWQPRQLVGAAAWLALVSLVFSLGLYLGVRAWLSLDRGQLQTLVFLLLVFTTQANVYVLRNDRSIGSFAPAPALVLATVLDVVGVSVLAVTGTWMDAIPISLVWIVIGMVIVLALLLDQVKRVVFDRYALSGKVASAA